MIKKQDYPHLDTPCFVIDKHALDENFNAIANAFNDAWPNTIIGYSVKTNALPWLIQYARSNGFYAEVVSDQELALALAVGYSNKEIVFNGPIKGKEMFRQVINGGGIVNIDSRRELNWLSELASSNNYNQLRVGIRVNIDLNKLCPGESRTGNESSRFGFCYYNNELKEAVDTINAIENVSLAGLHMHVNSLTRSAAVYSRIAEFASILKQEYELELSYVDIGGGFYGGTPNLSAYKEYAQAIREGMLQAYIPEETKLIIEPGGSILATPISFLAKVLDVKNIGQQRVVVTEASRVWLDSTMSKSDYRYELISESQSFIEDQMICGYTCMDTDRLMHVRNERELKEGDIIEFKMVGAYTYCFAPDFFIQTRPSYYVDDGEINLVQERDGIEKIMKGITWNQF